MNVTYDNVVQILEAADRMQATDMKKYSLGLIVQYFPKVNSKGGFPNTMSFLISFDTISCRSLNLVIPLQRILFLQVIRMPTLKTLGRDLLLEIMEALADEMSASKLCSDISTTSLNSEN